jgi:hypothetical protein
MKSIIGVCVAMLLLGTQATASQLSPDPDQEEFTNFRSSRAVSPTTGEIDLSFSLTLDTRESKWQTPLYSYTEFDPDYMWLYGGDDSHRADTYTVLKLAVEELPFLGGLKDMVRMAEKKLGRYAKKMKLTGNIDFSKKTSSDPEVEKENNFQFGIAIQKEEHAKTDYAFKEFMPAELGWSISFDIPDPAVKGVLDLGQHFSVKGKYGEEKELKALFTFPF